MELHGLLNIDKPLGWTSHDVVGRLRRILGTKRVGHAGTLDPAATGVLVAGVGRATRFLDFVQSGSKAYVAHVVLGRSSETGDIDGRSVDVTSHPRGEHPDLESIKNAFLPFIGEVQQVPPKYSAVKIDGEPMYRRARRGEIVDVPVRTVRIDSISMIAYKYPDLVLAIECGAGVYIRSLARDLGEYLGCTAYLHHLVRTQVGEFTLESSIEINDLAKLRFPQSWPTIATAIDCALAQNPGVFLSKSATEAWYHGRSIPAGESVQIPTALPVRSYSFAAEFAGVGTFASGNQENGLLRPRIVLPKN